MKKILKSVAVALATVTALVSCQKEALPTVSFEKSNEVLDAESSVSVKIVLSEAASADLTVPFTVSSTAGSEEAFTIGDGSQTGISIQAGKSEGSITVKNNGTELSAASLTLRIGEVSGYKLGINPQIVIALGATERVIYTFEKPKMRITENSSITVNVKIAGELSGDKFKSNSDIVLPISVAESSTAAGYTISSKEVVFSAGNNSSSFTVTAGPDVDEAGAVLTLGLKPESERFIAGAVSTVNVDFRKSTFIDVIAGSWKMAADLHTADDDLGIIEMMETELGQKIPFPAINEADAFEVAFAEDGTVDFTPSFEGDLKRYFRNCKLSSPVLSHIRYPISYVEYDAYAVTFSAVNFDFAKGDSDIKEAKVYLFQGDDTNALEMFLFCHTQKSNGYEKNYSLNSDFGGSLESYGMTLYDMAPDVFSLHYKFTRETAK